jgi:hypothetical protein
MDNNCSFTAHGQSQSYVTTSLSWNKAPIWGLRLDLYYCLTVTSFLMCYIASSRTAQKTLCPTIIPFLSDVFSELLPSNGSPICYRGRMFTVRCLAMDTCYRDSFTFYNSSQSVTAKDSFHSLLDYERLLFHDGWQIDLIPDAD